MTDDTMELSTQQYDAYVEVQGQVYRALDFGASPEGIEHAVEWDEALAAGLSPEDIQDAIDQAAETWEPRDEDEEEELFVGQPCRSAGPMGEKGGPS